MIESGLDSRPTPKSHRDIKRTAIVVSIAVSITWTWLDGESELDSRIDERETGNSVPK
jgi:hypothetical protein